jgi:hypothetical protein
MFLIVLYTLVSVCSIVDAGTIVCLKYLESSTTFVALLLMSQNQLIYQIQIFDSRVKTNRSKRFASQITQDDKKTERDRLNRS